MLVIADRDRAAGSRRRDGRRRIRSVRARPRWWRSRARNFKPASVRRTSKRLGPQDRSLVALRARRRHRRAGRRRSSARVALIAAADGAGRLVGPVVDCYPAAARSRLRCTLRRARLAMLLGVTRSRRGRQPDSVAALGTRRPTARRRLGRRRADVPRRICSARSDLIEEVGRHYGFDRLAGDVSAVCGRRRRRPIRASPRDRLVRRVADGRRAVGSGDLRVHRRQGRQKRSRARGRHAWLAIANPLSAKFDTLRPSLLPGLVRRRSPHNRRHGRRDVRLSSRSGPGSRRTAKRAEWQIAWTGTAGEPLVGAGARGGLFDVEGAVVERLCDAIRRAVRMRRRARDRSLPPAKRRRSSSTDGQRRRDDGRRRRASARRRVADARGLPRQDRMFVARAESRIVLDARVIVSDADALGRFRATRSSSAICRSSSQTPLPAEIIRGTIQVGCNGRSSCRRRSLRSSFLSIAIRARACRKAPVSVSVRLTFQARRSHADRRRSPASPSTTILAARSSASMAPVNDSVVIGHVVRSTARERDMAKTATRSVELEPIDRLGRKMKLAGRRMVERDEEASRRALPRKTSGWRASLEAMRARLAVERRADRVRAVGAARKSATSSARASRRCSSSSEPLNL